MHPIKKFLTECLDDYFSISGRLSRQRYCILVFKVCLPITVGLILEWIIITALELGARFPHTVTFIHVIMYSTLAFSTIAIPCLTALRMHDIGKSGWWGWLQILTPFFPGGLLVGILFLWWLARKDGDPGTNKYGEPPPEDDD